MSRRVSGHVNQFSFHKFAIVRQCVGQRLKIFDCQPVQDGHRRILRYGAQTNAPAFVRHLFHASLPDIAALVIFLGMQRRVMETLFQHLDLLDLLV